MTDPSLTADEAAPSPRRTSWWRHNLIPLLSLVLLVPALVFVLLGLPLLDIASREPALIEVSAGETVEAAGFNWTVQASGEFIGEGVDDNSIPLGTALVAAIVSATAIDAAGATDTVFCEATLTRRAGLAEQRSWLTVSNPSQYNYGLQDASTSFCSLDDHTDFAYEMVFLTPEGTFDSSTVDITLSGAKRSILRFALER